MTVHGRAFGLLAAQPALAGLAARSFGFDLRRAGHGGAVRLASGAPLEPIAGDDTGGTYFVCGGGAVLYADREGRAGVIGDSPDEALELLVGLPCWHDLLHLSPRQESDGCWPKQPAWSRRDGRTYPNSTPIGRGCVPLSVSRTAPPSS